MSRDRLESEPRRSRISRACTTAPLIPWRCTMTALPKRLLASNITFASCWTIPISRPAGLKARSDRSHDTVRKGARFVMREVASASCMYLRWTSGLDVRGIPSTIEWLRSGLEAFAKAFRSFVVHSIHHSFTTNLFQILEYRIVSAVPRHARFTLSGNGRQVSESKFKP